MGGKSHESLLVGGGYATKSIYKDLRKAALEQSKKGMPSLQQYTRKLINH